MKRLPVMLLVCGMAALVPAGFAQETQSGETETPIPEEDGLELWKWANFLVLAGGIGYVIGKNAGPMFAARSLQIRKDIVEAEGVRQDAEARAAEVDRRLANLEMEIAALREEARREAESETRRLEEHTAAEIGKIQAHAEQEIAAAAKSARVELKRYSAELAIGLAERKVRERMTPEVQDSLVQSFVRDLQ